MNLNQMMLVHKKNPVVKSFDELKGHDVGVVLGYTGDIAVSEIEHIVEMKIFSI